jgi:hypothetical protein
MRQLILISICILAISSISKAQSAFDEVAPQQNNPAKIHLYPNPATEFIHVRLEGVKVVNLKLKVHNIIGNEMPAEVEFLGENELRVRVKEFATGYYLLAMQEEESNFAGTYKFVKR